MIFKLITDTLSPNIILFINNYFTESKLTIVLKVRRIAMCETIKQTRLDLSELLLKMKKKYAKNISYEVLAVIVKDNLLFLN